MTMQGQKENECADDKVEKLRRHILPADETSMEQARAHWMTVGKPLFSLGKLEDAVIRMAGIKRSADYTLEKKALVILCADNGIVAEGVTQTGQEVTAIVAENFTKGAASTNIMAEVAGVDIFPVDIGMATDVSGLTVGEKKVARGTKNFAKEPAMSRQEVWKAIEVGIGIVRELREKGYGVIATGEMGIGNTTTSSAVASVLLGKDPEEVTGKGAGLTSEGLKRKIRVIREAIRTHAPYAQDVPDVLSKVGGLDIAGMTGLFLGGALYHVPVVIDGFISAVAALCAVRMVPDAAGYVLPTHVSAEPAGAMILEALHLTPFLTCDMCLGEGSGAVAVMPLLEMGLQVYRKMGSFSDIQVEQYQILK